MASLMENLLVTLDEECNVYEQLIPIAHTKTKAIISNSLEELKEITDKEQDIVDSLTHLEKQRKTIVKDIAEVLGINANTITISELVKLLDKQPKEKEELSKLQYRLKGVMNELVTVNEHNKILIAQSLEMVQFNMNLIQSTMMAPQTANYDKGVYTSNLSAIPRRAMFDTKQ